MTTLTIPILTKRSNTAGFVPSTTDIAYGELFINTVDGKLFLKKNVSGTPTIIDVASSATTGVFSFNTRTGAVTLTSGDVTTALGFTPGTVTSVGVSSSGTYAGALTVGSSPITSSGTITITPNLFSTSSTTAGVVPGSNGSTSSFLRGDGTWASPGGGVSSFNTRTGAVTLTSGDVTGALGFTPGTVTSVGVTSTDLSVSGSPVTTSGSITLNLAAMPAHTYKGNNTGSSAAPVNVTSTQLTADLDLFTSTLKGLAPASGGGTTNYLRADGTWASPGGGVTSFNTRTGAITLTSGDVTGALGFTPYNATNPSGYISSASMAALTDVNLTSIANGQLLKYDSTSSKWLNWTPTYISGNQTITLSGDISGSGTTAITSTLATVNSNVGTYGSASAVPVFTVNGKGLVTGVTNTNISISLNTQATGTLQAAQFPALTGDITTTAGSLATSLSTTGVSAGTYGQVTVDTKGRVTSGTTVTDIAHGGTGASTVGGALSGLTGGVITINTGTLDTTISTPDTGVLTLQSQVLGYHVSTATAMSGSAYNFTSFDTNGTNKYCALVAGAPSTTNVFWSTNGTSWSSGGNMPMTAVWNSVRWIPAFSKFIATSVVASPTWGYVAYSNDGQTWVLPSIFNTTGGDKTPALTDGTYGYVFNADGGSTAAVWVSADGINWYTATTTSTPPVATLHALYNGSGFILLNSLNTDVYWLTVGGTLPASPTLTSTKLAGALSFTLNTSSKAVVVGTTTYVIDVANGKMHKSLNGTIWTSTNVTFPFGSITLTKMVTDGTRLIVGGYGCSGDYIWTSLDGITWTADPTAVTAAYFPELLRYTNSTLYGVGSSALTPYFTTYTSADSAVAPVIPKMSLCDSSNRAASTSWVHDYVAANAVTSVGITSSGSSSGAITVGSSPITSSGIITITPNLFSTSATTAGVVPGSNGGSTLFLRGDGSWAAPSSATAHCTESVLLATAAALPTCTAAGTGASKTLTASTPGSALTVDSTATAVGNRILVKNQATGADNGIYTLTTQGVAGAAQVYTYQTTYYASHSNQSTYANSYITLSTTTTKYYVWFDGGSGTDPTPSGYTRIGSAGVTGFGADTDAQLITRLVNFINTNASAQFTASASGNTMTVTNVTQGPAVQAPNSYQYSTGPFFNPPIVGSTTTVTTAGVSPIAWVLTRASDYLTPSPGDVTPVNSGSTNAHKFYQLSNTSAVTIDTTALTYAQAGGGVGTVTSVDFSAPAEFSVSGNPITSSGTITLSKANQTANTVWAGPTTGAAVAPSFRALVAADIPTISLSTGVSGTLQAAQFPALTGDVTTSAGSLATTLTNTAVTAGSYTLSNVTFDAKGRATAAASASASDINTTFGSQTANRFYAAPNGSAGTPSFRAIVAADIPTLNQNTTGTASNVTGVVAIANGGTGQTTANAALNALLPTQTSNSGKYLTTDGTNTSWVPVSSGSTADSVVVTFCGGI